MKVRIAGFNRSSIVDGIGMRYTLFMQGCKHNCKGCQNPSTHDLNGGVEIDTDLIINDIKKSEYYDGITLSGGDPFFQLEAAKEIAKQVKELGKTVWVYTGFTIEQILKDDKLKSLLEYTDVLVDGKFDINKRTLNKRFVGSSNQRIIDIKKTLDTNEIIEFRGDTNE